MTCRTTCPPQPVASTRSWSSKGRAVDPCPCAAFSSGGSRPESWQEEGFTQKDSGTRSGAWHMHQTCNWGAAPSRSVLPFDGFEGRSVCWARRPLGRRGRNALKPSALVQDERQRIVRSVYEGSEHAGWSNIMSDVGSLSSARIALQHVTFPEHERMLSPRAQQTVHSRPSRDCGSYCGITLCFRITYLRNASCSVMSRNRSRIPGRRPESDPRRGARWRWRKTIALNAVARTRTG